MDQEPRGYSTHEQVFDRLEELGVEVVHVPYHGAHDESFVEAVELYGSDPTGRSDSPKYVLEEGSIFGDINPDGDRLEAEDEDELREALEEPIYDQLGEAFGDSVDGVDGVAVWRVSEREVVVEHSYLDWHSEELRA